MCACMYHRIASVGDVDRMTAEQAAVNFCAHDACNANVLREKRESR